MFRVVIPARHGSSRLPGKPLLPLAGRPMIEHVHRLALASGADEVLVATDDERIRDACRAFGAEVEMTSPDHPSGTDRIAEVAGCRGWPDDAVIVNLQGDEPLLPPQLVLQVATLLLDDPSADLGTLCAPIGSLEEFLDPNVVKLVTQRDGSALYFSRAPIPWCRDGAASGLSSQQRHDGALRHLGLYAYRSAALRRLAAAPPTELERLERLEQLRALQIGLRILVAPAVAEPGPGVDTPEDLTRAGELLQAARR